MLGSKPEEKVAEPMPAVNGDLGPEVASDNSKDGAPTPTLINNRFSFGVPSTGLPPNGVKNDDRNNDGTDRDRVHSNDNNVNDLGLKRQKSQVSVQSEAKSSDQSERAVCLGFQADD